MISSFKADDRSKARGVALCLFFLLGTAAATPALAQQDMRARMDRIENEIQTLSRAVFKGETPPPGAVPGMGMDAGAQANIEVRLSQMEQQLRTLTGRMEEQDFALRQLQEKMNASLMAMEARVNSGAAAGPLASETVVSSSGVSPAPAAAPGLAQEYPSLPSPLTPGGTSQSASSAGPAAGAAADQAASVTTSPTAGNLGALAQTPAGTLEGLSGGPADMYEQAFSHLRDKSYDEAEAGFSAFLAQYPEHSLAPNAKYWLGETYYVRNQFERAARVFAEAYQKYPKAPKAADSLLKMALSLAGMGKKSDACVALAQLRKQYAGGANPVLARAESERQNLSCPD